MAIPDSALRRLVAGTLMPGFVGATLPDWIRREGGAGLRAVCLYGANVANPHQLSALVAELRAALPDGIVAVDEEGGDVTRLHYPEGSNLPGNAVLGRLDDTDLTHACAAAIGGELAASGINLDLAPVVDVNSAPDNPVIGVRSFGSEPALVARHTAAWVEGLQSVGVAACAKHFPGHGDTVTDSHLGLPRVDATLATVQERELVPFRAAIAAGTASIMTSHIIVSAIDAHRPATFSPTILQGVLREVLGFRGVIISDALDMAGASAITGIPEAAVRALAAGCDLLCIGSETTPEGYLAIVDAILDAVAGGRLDEGRVREAADRVRTLAASHPALSPPQPPDREHVDPGAIAAAFEIAPTVAAWLAAPGPAAIVQVDSTSNLAVGEVAWGPAAVGCTTSVDAVPADARVAVVGRGLEPGHPAWVLTQRLRDAGHPVVVVDCGWPRGGADIVTFGGSPAVGRALADLLGLP